MMKFHTLSPLDTKKCAEKFATEIKAGVHKKNGALIIGFVGDLGSGKTTFIKKFARALGVRSSVTSPTFLIQKKYKLKHKNFLSLIHVDAYRIGKPGEMNRIGFGDEIKNKNNIIVIEWADIIKKILPKKIMWVTFKHGKKENERYITVKK